ncbi:MAG: hypothetical protein LW826_05915 [Candidatus Jidaibacter sp.]|nr:hypothetical protein [Candidatus Jidaibacter sp.]
MNSLRKDSIPKIESLLRFNTSLRTLFLLRNPIYPDGAKFIAKGLKHNSALPML